MTAHVIAVHPRVLGAGGRARAPDTTLHETAGRRRATGQTRYAQTRRRGSRRLRVRARPELAVRPPALSRSTSSPRLDAEATRQHLQPLAAYMRQRLRTRRAAPGCTATWTTSRRRSTAPNAAALINANPAQAVRLVRAGYDIVAHELPAQSPGGMHRGRPRAPDSPYRTLADLRGQRIAFGGGAHACFAYIVPEAMFSARPGWRAAITRTSRARGRSPTP